jgi:hypothetical protein
MGFRFQRHGGSHSPTTALVWALGSRSEEKSATEFIDRRLYRKTPLFDRFVKFNVEVDGLGIRH